MGLPVSLPGVKVPEQFYWVLADFPAPLAGMKHPTWNPPWRLLSGAGFSQVLCLNPSGPKYDLGGFSSHTIDLEALVHGGPPRRSPEAEERKRIHDAAHFVLRHLLASQGVLVHCEGGTGRTGVVVGCALVGLGMGPDLVVSFLKALNRNRGRDWPESPWHEKVLREFNPRQDLEPRLALP